MKSVLIIYNQALTEKVDYMIDKLNIRGFSKWQEVLGRGSVDGDPRMGTHTWPETNSATIVIIDDEKVEVLLNTIKKLDAINEEVGIRAFVWDVLRSV